MTHKTWTANFEDGRHTIDLEHGFFSGKRVISVDGHVVHESQTLFDTGGRYPVHIAGHSCVVEIRTNGFRFFYDFRPNEIAVPPVTPRWVWLFVVAIILIPIVTLGGAIAGGIAGGGAAMCYVASRNDRWDTTAQVIACIGITVICWGLVFGLGFFAVLGSRLAR